MNKYSVTYQTSQVVTQEIEALSIDDAIDQIEKEAIKNGLKITRYEVIELIKPEKSEFKPIISKK